MTGSGSIVSLLVNPIGELRSLRMFWRETLPRGILFLFRPKKQFNIFVHSRLAWLNLSSTIRSAFLRFSCLPMPRTFSVTSQPVANLASGYSGQTLPIERNTYGLKFALMVDCVPIPGRC